MNPYPQSMQTITDLPLEMLNYLCTHLNWMDVVMLQLAIPNLRVNECGIHYDFQIMKLKQTIKLFRKLKRLQCKFRKRFKRYIYHSQVPFLHPAMEKVTSLIRKQMQLVYLIQKVEKELQVKFSNDEDIDIVCSYCETRFYNVNALETHSRIIFPKCKVINIV
jgi:hypothetical protein